MTASPLGPIGVSLRLHPFFLQIIFQQRPDLEIVIHDQDVLYLVHRDY
jgi:hypothetical protein